MSVKSRLQQRKIWFTLEQSAQRLSDEFNEDITAENVLELALEGDLAISVQVYGAQKVLPLQKGERLGVVSAPSLSPVIGYKPGLPGLPEEVTGHIGAGVYQVGIDIPSTQQHLHRLIGGEALGTAGTPAWYLIMDDADGGEPHLFVPLQPVEGIKPLPLPSMQSLLIRRADLDAFIASVVPAPQQEKKLHPKRRNSYLTLIEALVLDVLGGEIPVQEHKAAEMLQTVIQNKGLKIKSETVAKIIKEVQAIREDRETEQA